MSKIDLQKIYRMIREAKRNSVQSLSPPSFEDYVSQQVLHAIGARDFIRGRDYVTFKIRVLGRDGNLFVRVQLGKKLTVRLFQISGLTVTCIREQNDVPCESLAGILERIHENTWA